MLEKTGSWGCQENTCSLKFDQESGTVYVLMHVFKPFPTKKKPKQNIDGKNSYSIRR